MRVRVAVVIAAAALAAPCAAGAAPLTSWPFDEGTGTVVHDATGNGHDGTLSGAVTWTTGSNGGALALDGTSGYVAFSVGNSIALYPGSGSMTLAASVRRASPQPSGTAGVIIEHSDCGTVCHDYSQSLYALDVVDDHLQMRLSRREGPVQVLEGCAVVTDGAWHRAMAVRDVANVQMRLYVDGKLDASQPLYTPISSIDNGDADFNALTIGAGTVSGGVTRTSFFGGLLDDVSYANESFGVAAGPGSGCVPSIASFTPAKAGIGRRVVITGRSFSYATSVTFNGVTSAFTIDSDTQITATVPSTATSGPISVTNEVGSATTATTFTVTPSMLLAPSSGPPNQQVAVSGGGFHAGSLVTVKWNCATASCASTTVLATPQANALGGFTAVLPIPAEVPFGDYVIGARDASGSFGKVRYKIVPKLTVSPVHARPGAKIALTGHGYHASSLVTVKWDCPKQSCSSSTVLATPTADASGAFSTTAIVPSLTTRLVRIGGQDTVGGFASAAFRVLPTLSILPTSGASGSSATVTGDYYQPGETVTLLWDCPTNSCSSSYVLAAPTADAAGHFSATVGMDAPGTVAGTTYSIRGRGATSLQSAFAKFKITVCATC